MWLNGTPILVDNKQVAEVIVTSAGSMFMIRNLRPNGTVGVCFTSPDKQKISDWLAENYPGFTKGKRS